MRLRLSHTSSFLTTHESPPFALLWRGGHSRIGVIVTSLLLGACETTAILLFRQTTLLDLSAVVAGSIVFLAAYVTFSFYVKKTLKEEEAEVKEIRGEQPYASHGMIFHG